MATDFRTNSLLVGFLGRGTILKHLKWEGSSYLLHSPLLPLPFPPFPPLPFFCFPLPPSLLYRVPRILYYYYLFLFFIVIYDDMSFIVFFFFFLCLHNKLSLHCYYFSCLFILVYCCISSILPDVCSFCHACSFDSWATGRWSPALGLWLVPLPCLILPLLGGTILASL